MQIAWTAVEAVVLITAEIVGGRMNLPTWLLVLVGLAGGTYLLFTSDVWLRAWGGWSWPLRWQSGTRLRIAVLRKVLREASEYVGDGSTKDEDAFWCVVVLGNLFEKAFEYRVKTDYRAFVQNTNSPSFRGKLSRYLAQLSGSITREDINDTYDPPTSLSALLEKNA